MLVEKFLGFNVVIGIDPGKHGGIACLSFGLGVYDVMEMLNDEKELIQFFKDFYDDGYLRIVYIEHQHAFPKQGVVSTFNFGKHYGFLLGVLRSIGYEVVEVSSKAWKSFFGLNKGLSRGAKRKEVKSLSIQKAKELFPDLEEKIGKHDGMAEALLIAEYGRRKEKEKRAKWKC